MRFLSKRFWTIGVALLASVGGVAPALAAPVGVEVKTTLGPVAAGTQVVAFSYDVRQIYPAVAARFEPMRPHAAGDGTLTPLTDWEDYHLVHAKQLEYFRESFRKAHQGEDAILKAVMPRFDSVFTKYGSSAPELSGMDVLSHEDARKNWCAKVTAGLNSVMADYNGGVPRAAGPGGADPALYSRWRGQRDEALREAVQGAGAAGGSLAYVEGESNEDGMAVLDLPPGRWYLACQSGDLGWYVAIEVSARGGRVPLGPQEAVRMTLDLAAWTGD